MGTVTPVDEYAGTITFPDNGDDLEAPDVEAVIQILANRGKHLLDATAGLAVWGWKLRVAPGGAASGNTGVFVPMIEALNLLSGTSRYAERLSGETQLTTADHFGGGTLPNSSWLYIYAKVSASALALEISADAPEAGLVWKSGAGGTHRYLGCFRTDSFGVPIPMQMARGTYRYDLSEVTASVLQALNITSAVPTSFSNVDCSALIPPHATLGHFRIEMVNADATNWGRTELRKDGATTDVLQVDCPPAGASHSAYHRECFDLQVSASTRVIEYRAVTSSSRADCDISIQVLGFSE